MRILLLGLNYAPEPVGIGPYTTGMAEALAAAGHEVEVVAGKPYYPRWRPDPAFKGIGYDRRVENGVAVLRCPHYVPVDPSGPRRIAHHLSFAASALRPTLARARRFRPQVVMTVAPSLLAVPVARAAARLARAPGWLHIQDFEIEAAFATGLLDEQSRAGRLAKRLQNTAMDGFAVYSSISPQMCARLARMGVAPESIVELRNWADIDQIRPLDGESPYRREWKVTAPTVALYSGNIANKQGIGLVLDAARALRGRSDVQFVVCGEGPQRAQLIAAAADLPNIQFHPLQPYERLRELMGLATVHLLPQLASAADLVLPSKLTNMLASGRPVVATADPGTGLAAEVAGCGIVTPPGDGNAMADAITRLADDPALRREFGAAARARAEERWSKRAILAGLEARLEALTRQPIRR